jgi:hypothetical protein
MATSSTNSKTPTAATPDIEGLEFGSVGENVMIAVDGDWLYVAMNTKHRGGKSSSGKTTTVASSRGNQKITTHNGDISVGINAYVKP